MKHDTHIFLATEAIDRLVENAGLARTVGGRAVGRARRKRLEAAAKELQRLLLYHRDAVLEAAWAPDDVLADKALYHTFKLFSAASFPKMKKPPAGAQFVPSAPRIRGAGGASSARGASSAKAAPGSPDPFYRLPGSGGLPYKVDHLARVIADMRKLRAYNDQFSQRQIIYMYLLISHYVADACAPMHCDLRDDPPSAGDGAKPKGSYFPASLHGQVEELWERAKPPRVASTGIVDVESAGLMEHMIALCVDSARQSLELFPPGRESAWSAKAITDGVTEAIFGRAVGAVGTVWIAVAG
jgi:hypothetical protein